MLSLSLGPGFVPIKTKRLLAPCRAKSEDFSDFPDDYVQAIRLAQQGTKKALDAGALLIEIEFPTASLASVAGDAEGSNESNYSMGFVRKFSRIFQSQAQSTRIFFPTQEELRIAVAGKSKDPNAGSWDIDPVFEQTEFQLDYLTKPTGLLDIGLNINRFDPAARVKDSDDLCIIAYPNFDPRELIAAEAVAKALEKRRRPTILFNAELDRLRSNYYPSLFYPEMARLSRDFVPKVETAFYIHNFKGAGGGALFRVYPEPWQVCVRYRDGTLVRVHSQEDRPSLREVSLEILPKAVRNLQS